ncbi:MAG: hypothetical protein LBL46_03900 [Rickettsiales bacterium]|jgi:hypothetical protein|nr:hypothetical protein [Rickettsiales bacterium]
MFKRTENREQRTENREGVRRNARRYFARFSVLCSLFSLFFIGAANAVCPVCTVAVGAGLEGARMIGLDDIITGIWAGAFTLIMIFWTAKYMAHKGVENAIWYILDVAVWYAFLGMLYLTPTLTYGADTLWGVDRFLMGIAAGSVVYYAAEKFNAKLLHKNGGKSYFKFQKVIIPFGSLLVLSGAAAMVVLL